MLAIAWQYLTGRCVATDPADRQTAEWPPHPDRVVQALVAAWGESGAKESERTALEWLMALPAPSLAVPEVVSACQVVKTYVPVNDIETKAKSEYNEKMIALLPSQRTRKERYFPAISTGDGTVALIYSAAEPSAVVRAALVTLCSQVTYIGHSSSLVRMWLCDDPPPATIVPVSRGAEYQLRIPTTGRLAILEQAFADGGKDWKRPPTAPWQGYGCHIASDLPRGAFDSQLIVLRQVGGQRFQLEQTKALVLALRGALISAADANPLAKRLISGHEADGTPLQDPHIAYLPLAFVGDANNSYGGQHADGHLLGMALAMPRNLPADVEQMIYDCLAPVLGYGEKPCRLTLGAAGVMEVSLEDRPQPPATLRSSTWCREAKSWGTVTPIVLDRLPPRRHADLDAWAAEQIAASCVRQGIPMPVAIMPLPVSPCLGVPAARAFPPQRRKDGGSRWHIHARLEFAEKIAGPILLGASRYHGYGLCRPLQELSS